MKKRYKLSALLIAAILLTLALAGAALATSGFGIFDRAEVTPLDGAKALIETSLGVTDNELVRLTVEEAVRDDNGVVVLLRLTPLDPEHYALFNDGLEDAPEGVYLFENFIGDDGTEHRRVVGRADGKTVIRYWPTLQAKELASSDSIDAVAQSDGSVSVRIRLSVPSDEELTDTCLFTAGATLIVNDERTRLADIQFTLSRREQTRSAVYAPAGNGEIERVKVYGLHLSSTSVSAVAHISYAYLPTDTEMGIAFHYYGDDGIAYELGSGECAPLPDGEYEIPDGYKAETWTDRLQALSEFPDELIVEAKVIGEDIILGRVTLKRVDE